MRASCLVGVLLGGEMIMFFSAVKFASVVNVTVIGAAQPVLVLIAAHFLFGERIGGWGVFWILLAVVGVTITVLGPSVTSHRQLIGDLLATGSLLCWSAYWLVDKHSRKMHEAIDYTTGVTITAALLVTLLALLSRQSLGDVKTSDWLWFLLLALVPGSGHLVMNWAHRYVDASISSAISCLSPLVAAVAAILILGQTVRAVQVYGVLLGLAAIAVLVTRYRETVEPEPG